MSGALRQYLAVVLAGTDADDREITTEARTIGEAVVAIERTLDAQSGHRIVAIEEWWGQGAAHGL